MSGEPKEQRTPEENAVKDEYAETSGRGGDAAPEGGDSSQADDYEALVRLVKENEELKDARLRAAAEMENLRRRTQRDVADARAYAVSNFARDMLAVSDNLRRALDAIPQETRDAGEAGFTALIEGVEMTERAMLSALERHGVKKINPEGERFDPHFHQAMFEVPNAEIAANTVVQVVQTGYVIGDRVLRPAMVGVSKGGPKPVAGEADAPAEEPGPPNEQAEKDA